MFPPAEHLFAWLIYLLSTIGLLVVFWRITEKIIPACSLRQLLRLSIAVLLMTPYTVNQSSDYLAPAWAMVGLETVFSGLDNVWRVGKPLLIVWCITVLLYYVAIGMHKILKKLKPIDHV